MLKSVTTHVRGLAKRALASNPRLLKNNRVYLEVQRFRAQNGVRLRPELTDRPDLLEALARDGVVVVPSFLPRAWCEEVLAASEPLMEQAKRGERPDAFTVQPHIVYRLARADRTVRESERFFRDPTVRDVFRAYVSPDVVSYRRELEFRFGIAHMAQADLFHFDNWRPICKAFLYLTDVGPANAPFAYLKRSHVGGAWRVPHELAFEVDGKTGAFGHFFPQQVRDLEKRHGWEEQICTGPAGTLILADLRGLHRGTPLLEGRRVLLNNTFDLLNPDPDAQG